MTVKQLKALGFKHDYDSEIEEATPPDEFSYSVYKIDIGDTYLEAIIEYGKNKKRRLIYFLLGEDLELNGRNLTIKDIEMLKEIIGTKTVNDLLK